MYRRLTSIRYLLTRDRAAVTAFLIEPMRGARLSPDPAAPDPLSLDPAAPVSSDPVSPVSIRERADRIRERADLIRERADLVRRFVRITNAVRGYHTLREMLAISTEILRRRGRPGLTVLEAGCGKGASTAKLSLATRRAGGRLLVYDSFRGIPDNGERHQHLDGREVVFRAGAFRGTLASVQRTVARFGAPEVCHFEKGLFAHTLPGLRARLDVVVLDVDLESATRTCIVELFPRLAPDGVLLSLDGQLRATHALLGDPAFWRDQVGVPMPRIEGLWQDKLLVIRPRPPGAGPGTTAGAMGPAHSAFGSVSSRTQLR